MSPSQPPLPFARPHNNQQLFSDYYLDRILPTRPEWQILYAKAEAALRAVSGILVAYLPSDNEAQTEQDLVRPILKALGHDFEVQPALKTPDGAKRPDYVFYRDAAALAANKNKMLTDALPQQGGFAVGEAKYYGRPLDTTLKSKTGDPFSNKNPAFQIAFYMQHSGAEWGLLTNGRLWRLFHKDTAHKLDRFYEVDLPALLETDDPNAFLYFYAFFRREAFEEQRPDGVAAILRAGQDYARGIGDKLNEQVYDALRHLAQGFLDYAPNALTADPPTLKAIYDNALVVLYRLLFVFYAEDRDLLPVHEPGAYRETYSLYAVKRDIADGLRWGKRLLPDSATLWPRLKELFRIIDKGSPPLRVATFNGGLFDPERHPFLERCAVGDAHLQRALDKLARVHDQFVDYRDLSVRHLGAIYEGLLEYRLEAEVDSASETPAAPGTEREGWTVRLRNDKGERKATGSYYTPDYIVKYIVEQAVAPALAEAVAPALAEAVAGKTDDAARVEAVLGVNVLDPAMGSGHFLVEATEVIARFLVDLDIVVEDAPGEADLAYWKRRVVQSCIYGIDLNPLAVELAKLSLWLTTVAAGRPLSFLDHHLRVGNALVGARLDDLQIHTARKPARRANGKAAAQEAAGQLSMLGDDAFRQSMFQAVTSMWLIESSGSQDVGQVKEQERLYAELRKQFTRKYGRLANLATATHFGLSVDPALWTPLADYAMGRTLTALPQLTAWADEAETTAERFRFFHYELEFPEVFFDRFGRPLEERAGFDVVVGNPPYVRQEQLTVFKPYFETCYKAVHGVADLYLYFYERGVNVLRRDGRLSYISSGTFARANFATAFRKWLPGAAQMESIIDFGENQPFAGAEMVRPSIVVLRKRPQESSFRSLFLAAKVPPSLEQALAEEGINCDPAALQQSEWTFQPAGNTRLFEKIAKTGRKLAEVTDGRIYYGVKTGLNEAFIIDRATRDRIVAADAASAEIIKRVLQGEDLRPWYQEDEDRWLIALPSGWTRAQFGEGLEEGPAWEEFAQVHPGVAEHLAGFAEAARKRWDKGDYWWELRSCDYYAAFDRPKIFWPDISKLPRFSWDAEGTYIGNTGYIIPDPHPSLLGILQSRVIWFAVSQLCQPLRLRAGLWQYRVLPQFITRLPVPDAPDDEREAIGALALSLTEQARARYDLHQKTRHRLRSDFGVPGKNLNQKLTAWWELDFPALRAELQKTFKRDIPVKERDEVEAWFADRKAEHQRRTAEIVRLETELNTRVYALFALSPDEIAIVEASTKYRYGEV